MNASSVRATREWKTKVFRRVRPGMMFSVFSTGMTYGKRIVIVVAKHSASLEVIELTRENISLIITGYQAKRSVIAYEDFISETFHIVDPPHLSVK